MNHVLINHHNCQNLNCRGVILHIFLPVLYDLQNVYELPASLVID